MKKIIVIFLSILILVVVGCAEETEYYENDVTSVASEEKKPEIEYPTKPIEIIVPFAAGGSTDIGARILDKYLPNYLPNAQFVIVNKPGGGGTIAMSDLFTAKPDGYKIALATHRAVDTFPLYGKTKYAHDSFEPIAKVFINQQIMIVKNDAPWQTFDEWVEYVKKNPGQFTYGASGGLGSATHLPMAELEKIAGLQTKPVPFEGTPPAITAVLGGHVNGALVQPSDAKVLIESGELRALFNTASEPISYMPDVPILKEEGYDVVYGTNASLMAPKGVPAEIITMLQEALKQTMEDPEVIAEFEKVNMQLQYATAEEVQNQLNAENEKTAILLKELGLIE